MKASRGSGDKGKTSLFSGGRVKKTHSRIEACGDVDELNSVLGGLVSSLSADQTHLVQEIKGIQSALLTAGALLGTDSASPSAASLAEITKDDIDALETATDRIHKALPKLTGFVIPGGHVSSSWAHLARTVCRRAERRVIAMIEGTGEGAADQRTSSIVIYLNRLSDYLFCVSRHCNQVTGTAEEFWKK